MLDSTRAECASASVANDALDRRIDKRNQTRRLLSAEQEAYAAMDVEVLVDVDDAFVAPLARVAERTLKDAPEEPRAREAGRRARRRQGVESMAKARPLSSDIIPSSSEYTLRFALERLLRLSERLRFAFVELVVGSKPTAAEVRPALVGADLGVEITHDTKAGWIELELKDELGAHHEKDQLERYLKNLRKRRVSNAVLVVIAAGPDLPAASVPVAAVAAEQGRFGRGSGGDCFTWREVTACLEGACSSEDERSAVDGLRRLAQRFEEPSTSRQPRRTFPGLEGLSNLAGLVERAQAPFARNGVGTLDELARVADAILAWDELDTRKAAADIARGARRALGAHGVKLGDVKLADYGCWFTGLDTKYRLGIDIERFLKATYYDRIQRLKDREDVRGLVLVPQVRVFVKTNVSSDDFTSHGVGRGLFRLKKAGERQKKPLPGLVYVAGLTGVAVEDLESGAWMQNVAEEFAACIRNKS